MSEGREIPIEWKIPETMRAVFANQMLVTHTDGQFVVVFFEALVPPILEGDSESIKNIDRVPAVAVARIAVPPKKMPDIIKALQNSYNRYLEREKQPNVPERG